MKKVWLVISIVVPILEFSVVCDNSFRRIAIPSSQIEPVSVQLARESNTIVSYDDLDMSLIKSGKLKQLVEKYGVKKVTSNPSIFLNALRRGDFDHEIKLLAAQGLSAEEIYNELYRRIVKLASQVLLPYWQNDPNNYFVSIETNPTTANDFWATVQEAKELNAMAENIDVKIAATPQGIEAVEEAIAQGVDVNVTLIFPGIKVFRVGEIPAKYREYGDKAYSLEIRGEKYVVIAPQFMDVIQAVETGYARFFDNHPGDYENAPRVVLSVFLSRMDTSKGAVDEQLDKLLQEGKITPEEFEHLRGKTGKYTGQLCYAILENWYNKSKIFQDLEENGVTPPRLLYASTKAKKDYIDGLNYVQPFQSSPAGLQIINTMPQPTFEILLQEGIVTPGSIKRGLDTAAGYVLQLQHLLQENFGIDLQDIALHLRDEGVKAFARAYQEAMEYINSVLNQP